MSTIINTAPPAGTRPSSMRGTLTTCEMADCCIRTVIITICM